ncbi:MAG: hypothetical protein B655_0068 [Methanobacterium sp. Maddingley MBC34]|nr:MAG: hypothetical protein B655_0068 [Methanobacterium sp. Maddingley MBC34]
MKNQEIKVGKPFKIENRVFYPLVKIFHCKHHDGEFYSLSPVAIVVVEEEMKYILPMEEGADLEKLKDLMDMIQ